MISNSGSKRERSASAGQSSAILRIAEKENVLALALRDLHGLLENYAPRWYTDEHRELAERGLRQAGRGLRKALSALYALLEEYAPTWYTEEQEKSAQLALESVGKEK